jgi:hypothetical protein
MCNYETAIKPCILRATKSGKIVRAGHVARMREMRNAYKFSRKTLEEETACLICCRWKDNIKMCLTEIICDGVDWMQIRQDSIQRIKKRQTLKYKQRLNI